MHTNVDMRAKMTFRTTNNSIYNTLYSDQGGIFRGKTGKIFPGNIIISQEILVENHALCRIFEEILVTGISYLWRFMLLK